VSLTELAAIKSGAFDDDDAEAVKGLDRIGGGRLHALKATPAMPAQYFPQRGMPPPGLPPPGFGQDTSFNFQPRLSSQGGLAPGAPFLDFTQQNAHFPAGPPPGLAQKRYRIYKTRESVVFFYRASQSNT
jgi:hypothetical protein